MQTDDSSNILTKSPTKKTFLGCFDSTASIIFSRTKAENKLFILDNVEETKKNFQEYINIKKFGILKELMIYQEKNDFLEEHEGFESQKVLIEDFILDENFKAFIQDLKVKTLEYSNLKQIQEIEEGEDIEEEELINETSKFKEIPNAKSKNFQEEIYFKDDNINIRKMKDDEKIFHEQIINFNSNLKQKLNKISSDKSNFRRRKIFVNKTEKKNFYFEMTNFKNNIEIKPKNSIDFCDSESDDEDEQNSENEDELYAKIQENMTSDESSNDEDN